MMSQPDLASLYQAAGREWNIDPALLQSVAQVESGANPATHPSVAGAQGLMQIMPDTAQRLGVADPNDPAQAIFGAAKLLSQNLDRYGNVPDALRAYNAGTDQSRWGNPETAAYVPKVQAAYARASAVPVLSQQQPVNDDDALLKNFAQGGNVTSAEQPSVSDDTLLKSFVGASASASAPVAPAPPPNDASGGVLADDPHYTYGTLLPLAADQQGNISLAVPEILRSPIRGVLSIGNKLIGQASNDNPLALTQDEQAAVGLLAGVGNNGAAAVSNKLISRSTAAQAQAEARAAQLPEDFAAQPFAPGFTPSTDGLPGTNAAGASLRPPGPATPVPHSATLPNGGNNLMGAEPPQSLPAAPIAPILTKSGAEARADQIIQHFAQGAPSVPSGNMLIPGSKPTLAQATGNGGLAILERTLQASDPAFAQALDVLGKQNAAARAQALGNLIGTPADIANAEAARDATTSAAREAAFANAQPVDIAPINEQIGALIEANKGRPTVQEPLMRVAGQLAEVAGEDATADPATLYNVRKYIGDIIAPKSAGTTQDGRAAAAQLQELKPTIDTTIESGAPGFKNYIQQFDQMSRPINGMQYLQNLNLTDGQGYTTLAKLDSAVKAIARAQGKNGAQLADSITPEQVQQLTALRDDMRIAAMSGAAKSIGSNTVQNLATNALLRGIGPETTTPIASAMRSIGHGTLLLQDPTFGVASIAADAARAGIGKLNSRAESMVRQSLYNKLLNGAGEAAGQ